MSGWIILGAVIVCFVVMIVFFLKRANKLQLPKGLLISTNGNYKGYKVHVIVSPKIPALDKQKQQQLVDSCARAAWAIDTMWALPRKDSVAETVVWFKSDNEFVGTDHYQIWAHNVASYIIRCHRMFGKSVPMAVIRERYIDEVIQRGEPVIHEWCHALLGEYVSSPSNHTQAKVWAVLGSATSQYQARVFFASKTGH